MIIVTLDIEKRQILMNGKVIDVDPVYAFSLAPEGTVIEVIGVQGSLVTLKIATPT